MKVQGVVVSWLVVSGLGVETAATTGAQAHAMRVRANIGKGLDERQVAVLRVKMTARFAA